MIDSKRSASSNVFAYSPPAHAPDGRMHLSSDCFASINTTHQYDLVRREDNFIALSERRGAPKTLLHFSGGTVWHRVFVSTTGSTAPRLEGSIARIAKAARM